MCECLLSKSRFTAGATGLLPTERAPMLRRCASELIMDSKGVAAGAGSVASRADASTAIIRVIKVTKVLRLLGLLRLLELLELLRFLGLLGLFR
jgi:hypothetical protein